ncbi:thiopeptide-type bacteriocin biosynthesis domain [Saccharomonospora marina XMU15]|uniref:Thiopeptide-type bacteriocin biosynthesis domain n=1 Tax=Saccharomonospora marina XMU15 TaxID=882083 RepID=H5X6W6_9PSEU|nr:thiopeptide-type bacteriocin biosynthesis protein [Saccharomonospora marina]EHR52395.1 thiopeptide-type bacteriocin biosynthesis domain [Saccharomonospora marina XMU15]
MPADHLTPRPTLEHAIATVLTGTPLDQAASAAGLDAPALADAVEVYRNAGQRALDQHTDPGWWQVYLRFTDWTRAEHTATQHLAPLLTLAADDGLSSGWWFIRKHPCWRLRLRVGPDHRDDLVQTLSSAFDDLTANGHLHSWWTGIYEPETAAFGDQPGIDIAHALFCADSHAILTLPHQSIGLGRRELSLLLCSTLMRAARTEWYEQGDIWHHVSRQRPLPADVTSGNVAAMADAIRQALLVDIPERGPLLSPGGPLALLAPWARAFRDAGHALGTAASEGRLRRGLREVISYATIFHWNRLGFTARTQAILAQAARTAILDAHTVTAARTDASASPVTG